MTRTTRRAGGPAGWLAAGLALAGAASCGPGPEAAEMEAPVQAAEPVAEFGIVIHGGAGTIRREDLTAEQEAAYHAALEAALRAGYAVLEGGGSALDAVQAAVVVMEDDSLFNAGRGAVFTAEGTNELDAAIMDGRTGNAGAVAGVKRIRNPVGLARLVMDESPHVFMTGEGAEFFGRQHGVEEVEPGYFRTERRWEALQRALTAEQVTSRGAPPGEEPHVSLGTVGAVALDRNRDLAAATSTGGMTAKRFGRVGDVPVVGAGTYADNASCAISGTGHGEFFIRNVVAHDVCARVLYTGASLEAAADAVVMRKLVEQDATGGVIGIDRRGNVTLTFNTPGMYRGHMLAGAEPVTAIFREE